MCQRQPRRHSKFLRSRHLSPENGRRFVMRRQTPIVQKVPMTLESPQVQFIDRVVDVPVMVQRQIPSLQVLVSHAQLVDKMVDVPHIMQQQGFSS